MAARMRETLTNIILMEMADDSDVFAAAFLSNQCYVDSRYLEQWERTRQRNNPDAHVENYVETVVPRYTDWQFKGHFRMYPDEFEMFYQWVGPHLPAGRGMSAERSLLAMLWLLANKESYRGVADRFAVNKGTLHHVVKSVCHTLVELRGDVIRWPRTQQELQQLAEGFKSRAGFPGVVGAVDGTYIKVTGKTGESRAAYICRKGYPAMHLQVVCSSDLRFLDVYTGNVGTVHDARVFRTSDLQALLESAQGLPTEYHILGDSAYPLREYLLVPFRDDGHLGPRERAYNYCHSQTRVDVERAIGLLKGKFRRLTDLDMTNTEEIPFVIFAACVIHNFIIQSSGVDEDDIVLSDSEEEEEDVVEEEEEDHDHDHDDDHDQGAGRLSAVEKRLAIARRLP